MRNDQQNSVVSFPGPGEATPDQDNSSNRAPNGHHTETNGQAAPLIKRWPPAMKAKVLQDVRDGVLSLDEACKRYALSIEEFLTWQHGVELFGLAGLRVNKQQELRRIRNRAKKAAPEGLHWSAAADPANNR